MTFYQFIPHLLQSYLVGPEHPELLSQLKWQGKHRDPIKKPYEEVHSHIPFSSVKFATQVIHDVELEHVKQVVGHFDKQSGVP